MTIDKNWLNRSNKDL
ncbi:hypothetical protein, partial [Haemophilus parainfluenzae]